PSYDRLNHTLALRIDKGWRRKSIDRLAAYTPQRILDIATGTGDFAILAAERLHPQEIVGADISEGMMAVGREKVAARGLDDIIRFQTEDCTRLSFAQSSFDAVTISFGARNFQDLDASLREVRRVLKPGGHLLLVELSTPPHFPMKQLFWLYAHVVMPVVGRFISGDDSAYTYLPQSMRAFPQAEEMERILQKNGFSEIVWKRYTFGLCTMFLAS
ncbi:MAG: bifunctional demethylmenaquinone methyltransferase/2-methoxy-6-polyprenyl-1,4-benzoquinol methylase UbiE, partial [Bacteroidaceae bacterium]|nr:bifunctional demethylmenaquinone methyltransferase/2-methoxy-6-polyprenyl-1,4-benzoquinol methylase UbiE [Bacteroidaceae bacterium]